MPKVKDAEIVDTATVCFSLNKVAQELFGLEANSVRVRIDDEGLLVLPSTRTKGLGNLPKTDRMIPLNRSAKLLRFSMPFPGVEIGDAFLIEGIGYGWTRFRPIPVEDISRNMPIARIV